MLLTKVPSIIYIFKKTQVEFFYTLVIAIIVSVLTYTFDLDIPNMPINIPAFLGTAIAVLIQFKLSQSYDRWCEARKIWGTIVNESRSFTLQLQSFITQGNDHVIRQMALRHIGWCYCLGQSLRGLDPLENLGKYISEDDLKKISTQNNKPLALLQLNSLQIAELKNDGKLDIFSQVHINTTLINFTKCHGNDRKNKKHRFSCNLSCFSSFNDLFICYYPFHLIRRYQPFF